MDKSDFLFYIMETFLELKIKRKIKLNIFLGQGYFKFIQMNQKVLSITINKQEKIIVLKMQPESYIGRLEEFFKNNNPDYKIIYTYHND